MEVHHPHHPTHKKKWSEYIIEFVMLFTAVTLGFFAENIREHQVISHRIEQNKVAILKDLLADSAEIARTFITADLSIKEFNRVNNLLFLAKTKKISYLQLEDSIKMTPKLIAVSVTLYMNNSSYKNMQSSGLLSYLEENELKRTLATYYEVDFKGVEAGNAFFDQIGTTFNSYMPIGVGRIIRKSQNFSNEFKLNGEEEYLNFMMNLKKTKNILQSDEFIYEIQKYYNWVFIYQIPLKRARENNNTLIKLLKSEINH